MNGERKPDEGCEAPGAGCPRSACLQLFVDGELDPTPASDLEAHIAACSACTERASLLAAMKESVRRRCAGRASDALRAKICMAVARESAPREDGVAAEFGAPATPSRESLFDGRVDLDGADRRSAARSSRVAYGVGALALAAGVALAVVGERVGDDEMMAQGHEGAPNDGDPRESRGDEGDGRLAAGHPAGLSQASAGDGLPGRALPGRALPGGAPGRLVPVAPQPTLVGLDTPSLSPSALAGRAVHTHDGRTTIDAVLDDLVAEHMNPLPPEETNLARLPRFERAVGVAMRAPKLRKYDARFRGARVLPIRGAQRTAMLTYELPDGERLTVYLWNPQAVPIGTTRLHPREMRDGEGGRGDKAPIYVGEARGYSIAACERRGVGYALATKRDADESVRMVAASVP